ALDAIGTGRVEGQGRALARLLHAAVARLVAGAGDEDVVSDGVVIDEFDPVAGLQGHLVPGELLVALPDGDLLGGWRSVDDHRLRRVLPVRGGHYGDRRRAHEGEERER